ncbi:unnamed protein product [Timema podura]|uniref:Uncharacterized protein n=1 Tax=Timema podura TaxID=61482 RepID=A0ABN7NZ94_TIMPD|nr:unnamed protein product [Timema podura]
MVELTYRCLRPNNKEAWTQNPKIWETSRSEAGCVGSQVILTNPRLSNHRPPLSDIHGHTTKGTHNEIGYYTRAANISHYSCHLQLTSTSKR